MISVEEGRVVGVIPPHSSTTKPSTRRDRVSNKLRELSRGRAKATGLVTICKHPYRRANLASATEVGN